MSNFLGLALVYLAAAVIALPIARRLGLGSVLGYLLAGIVIGPYVLNLVGKDQTSVLHFAEFGVVMMLFLVGLELEPSLLWRMRGSILGVGGLQVAASAILIGVVALIVGLTWRSALATGLTLALSSTAIVLQILSEKNLLKTEGGQSSFSVLLFQDIAVIPLLALMPLLGTVAVKESQGHGGAAPSGDGHAGGLDLSGLPGWANALVVLGAVVAVVVVGKYLAGPALRIVAKTRLRELFTAFSLMLVIGIAHLMTLVGLSPALGTFLAGVVLANSEFRHELESDIEPFKGLLLGLFFMSVGASINFTLIGDMPMQVTGAVFGLIILKCGVLAALAWFRKLKLDQGLIFSVALAQGGEFCFVLLGYATQVHAISKIEGQFLTVTVALSMVLTPIFFTFLEFVILPRFGTVETPTQREADTPEQQGPVLVAGFGRFGNIAGRFLMANGIQPTVLDHDSDQIDLLRKLGIKAYYGDVTRLDLLEAAGAHEARALIIALDDSDRSLHLAEAARKHFPNLRIILRARDRDHAYLLYRAGFDAVYHEMTGSAIEAGVAAMKALGFRAHRAFKAARAFYAYEQDSIRALSHHAHDEHEYFSHARHSVQNLSELLEDLNKGRAASPDSKGEFEI